jgi:hypothetical protein
MLSARKQRRQREKSQRKVSFSFSFFAHKKIFISVIVSLCIGLVIVAVFAIGDKKFWNGKDKLAVAVHEKNGVSVLLFDPQYGEVIRIIIPEHTQVDVAYGLGVWKIETLWELGKQQNVGGKILADTMTKYFRFPTAAWADTSALGLASGNIAEMYKSVFGIYSSNLSLGDKIALSWFSFNVPNAKHIDIDLSETNYLSKTNLSDGSSGYEKVEPAPPKIMSLFADPELSRVSHAISIQDATGQGNVAKNVGQVMEVLGAKVASISDQQETDLDCLVKGKNEALTQKVLILFSCKKSEGTTNFDVEILLGSQFAKRF